MKKKRYVDFASDALGPTQFCESCECCIPTANPIHTCYDAKGAREKSKQYIPAQPTGEPEKGKKYDSEKIPLDLLPTESLFRIAEVLAFGAKKYGAHNWRAGLHFSRVYGAALRHLLSWGNGEDKDPETGLSHLAHAGACVLFLLEYIKTHSELDDRYKV